VYFGSFKSAIALALLSGYAVAAEPGAAFTPAEQAAASRVTAEEISAPIRFLADDLLEGRFPGTRGSELAIRYLASELEGMGVEPGAVARGAGPPSFFQEVPLLRVVSTPPEEVVFRRGPESLSLPTGPGTEAGVVVRSLAGAGRVDIEGAELVFAGYGIVAPEHGWDDYRGLDVRGKVVVLLNMNPPFAGEGVRLWYGRWDYKFLEAARHGAAGALLVHTVESASYPWQVVTASNGRVGFRLADDPEPWLPFQGWIARGAAEALFRLAGKDLVAEEAAAKDERRRGSGGVPLGVRLSLHMPVAEERVLSANVVGRVPGTDPALRGEGVVFTAHHDHLGVRSPPVPGERNVYAGALDNASGCATLLAVARAAAAAPPRRSLYFVFPTAEEQGLLGSRFFARHPPLPAGRIAADLNVDVVNHLGRASDLTVVGLGKSTLDPVLAAVAAAQGRTVHGDTFPDRGSFYRSDHFELARVGVPAVSLRGGPTYPGRPAGWGKERQDEYVARDYHQTSDTYPPSPASWDLAGAVDDARLMLVAGLRLANAPALPAWKRGDEFERARLEAPR